MKRTFCKAAAAALAAALIFNQNCGAVMAASTHTRVSDGVYQLLDGTQISGIIARGIDVSHWQGSIDWKKAAADDVKFAMLGTRYNGEVDPYFKEFASGAVAAGIQIGAYIYSYALTVEEAQAEADFVLNLVKDYPISYPIAFDMENAEQGKLSKDELADLANAFCRKISDAGYYPIIYANDGWLANKLDMSKMNYDVWVARYETQHVYENPVMWQATETGQVNGVSGYCDIDFQYRDLSAKIASDLWRTIGGETFYYKNYVMQKNAWIHDGTGWFYLNSVGHKATGWFTEKGKTYYLDASTGRMVEGWQKSADGWMFFGSSGALQTGWIKDSGAWYYSNSSGVMQTGWLDDAGARYYLRDSGAMSVGWRSIDGTWYYFDGSGAMKTGWIGSDDTAWYYLDPGTGKMYANTQITVNGVTYNVDANGACAEVVEESTEAATEGDAAGAAGSGESGEAAAATGNSTTTDSVSTGTDTSSSLGNITYVAPFPG
jgi:GH25 family lysozyme M1 (1,4-beta-N-acetylmuramidase)